MDLEFIIPKIEECLRGGIDERVDAMRGMRTVLRSIDAPIRALHDLIDRELGALCEVARLNDALILRHIEERLQIPTGGLAPFIRRRTFPMPVGRKGAKPLYRVSDVSDWLRLNGVMIARVR